jgi:hypothetical protein
MKTDIKKLIINQYEHGGARIYIDGESGERLLLADTYHTPEFALYIYDCIVKYFNQD